jgi:hypothetical protein
MIHLLFRFDNETVHSNVDRTRVLYGERNPVVRNVYSVHGELDPWRPLGVQGDINVHSPTTVCPSKF